MPNVFNETPGRKPLARGVHDPTRYTPGVTRTRVLSPTSSVFDSMPIVVASSASRNVVAVLDVLEASGGGVGVGMEDVRRLKVERRAVADGP